jgi:hypothetical protein
MNVLEALDIHEDIIWRPTYMDDSSHRISFMKAHSAPSALYVLRVSIALSRYRISKRFARLNAGFELSRPPEAFKRALKLEKYANREIKLMIPEFTYWERNLQTSTHGRLRLPNIVSCSLERLLLKVSEPEEYSLKMIISLEQQRKNFRFYLIAIITFLKISSSPIKCLASSSEFQEPLSLHGSFRDQASF